MSIIHECLGLNRHIHIVYLVLSGSTSLIVRDGARLLVPDEVFDENGTNATLSDGPPNCKSKAFRFSEPNKFKSGFGIVGLLGPEMLP